MKHALNGKQNKLDFFKGDGWGRGEGGAWEGSYFTVEGLTLHPAALIECKDLVWTQPLLGELKESHGEVYLVLG